MCTEQVTLLSKLSVHETNYVILFVLRGSKIYINNEKELSYTIYNLYKSLNLPKRTWNTSQKHSNTSDTYIQLFCSQTTYFTHSFFNNVIALPEFRTHCTKCGALEIQTVFFLLCARN